MNKMAEAERKETKKKRVKGKFDKIYYHMKYEKDNDSIIDIFKDLEIAHNDLDDKHDFYSRLLDSDSLE